MPGRQSHGRSLLKQPRIKNNSKKKTIDAFSAAQQQIGERHRVRQSRLGHAEGGNRPGKRNREDGDEDEDDEEEFNAKKQKKGPAKGRFDELDIDEGSDSEGNTWKMGVVDSDDDSDIDSDEAFGESDEEKFEGYAFSGSSSNNKTSKKRTSQSKDLNLDEDDDGEDSGSELEEGDLGEDAIDLADMLDASSDEDEAEAEGSNGSGFEDEDEESDEESSASSTDEEEEDDSTDPSKLAALQSLIANLPQNEGKALAKQRSDGASEYATPSDFGLTSKNKLTLEDLGLPKISDPQIKRSLKFLEGGDGKKQVAGRLEVPLARRQQDRLDRSVAYDKSKETLDRWTDTVKHNRRADHLVFPLADPDADSARANTRLQSTTQSKPFNELEATIQSILEESGLATAGGRDDEDKIREYEELEMNKLSMEEVKARRNQLRMARELLYREELRAKRVKKIKSKSYRKVHRKQREKEEAKNRAALEEGGFVPSEDELEAQDRRRATERMGAKHRNSKWAKATKAMGRAAWDEDARDGITEMARREEELRKRVEGRAVRKEFEDDSDESMDDSNDDLSEEDEETEQKRNLRRLERIGRDDVIDNSAPGAKLANMKFMRNAEASRKKANDAMVEEMRKELVGEETSSEEEEDGDVGRRIFGPGSKAKDTPKKSQTLNEFEEAANSEDDENHMDVEFTGVDNGPKTTASAPKVKKINAVSKSSGQSSVSETEVATEGGAWSKVPLKSGIVSNKEANKRRHKSNNAMDIDELDLSQAVVMAKQPKAKKSKSKTVQILGASDEDSDDDDGAINLPFAIRDQELIKRAFAGADVVGDFEAEKKQTIEDEDEKVIDNTIPGWGSWVGDGVSKREKAKNKGRFLTKSEGIKEQNRKDAKLDRVIINEKRVKKVRIP